MKKELKGNKNREKLCFSKRLWLLSNQKQLVIKTHHVPIGLLFCSVGIRHGTAVSKITVSTVRQ